mmetsp:Transcript_69256/g.219146  ORF Transcript_69256/g.219146 Transcript_69256/m.219146 type:complete len:216 (-) Transcript_69256:118-765(-)
MESTEDLQGPGERWLSAEAASVFLGPILLAFQAYENDNDALDKRHLVFALNDLGIVDGIEPSRIAAVIDSEFRMAQASGMGDDIPFDEFGEFFNAVLRARQVLHSPLPSPPQGAARAHLQVLFREHLPPGSAGQFINAEGFHAALRPALGGDDLTATVVDLVYARAKQKGQDSMSYVQFAGALQILAQEKRVPLEELLGMLSAGGGGGRAPAPPR